MLAKQSSFHYMAVEGHMTLWDFANQEHDMCNPLLFFVSIILFSFNENC